MCAVHSINKCQLMERPLEHLKSIINAVAPYVLEPVILIMQ